MSTIHHSRRVALGIAVVLTLALVAPVAAQAPDRDLDVVAAPAGPSWDDTSGYGAVEASRAVIRHDAVVSGSTATSHAASAVTGFVWDEMSGYGAVETSRAAIVAPTELTSQVPRDVRWAPADVSEGLAPATPRHVLAAQRALRDSDPGSLVQEALLAIVAGSVPWDERSGYGSVEATRAAAPEAAIGASWDESTGYGSVEASRAGD